MVQYQITAILNGEDELEKFVVGQRLAKYATHVGGVINVTNSNLTQKILTKIYKDLDYEWIPTTVGSIENEIGKITNSEMISALIKK